MLISPVSSYPLLSHYFISNPALILILPKEAHFVHQRGYLELVLTLDSMLDKYPQLKTTRQMADLDPLCSGTEYAALA